MGRKVERFQFTAGSQIAPSTEDPTMALIGSGLLDPALVWVTLPEDLGGTQALITIRFRRSCPQGCEVQHAAALLDALTPDGRTIGVIECGGRFLWYAAKEQP